MAAQQHGWVSLHTPPEELLLSNTLPTGQSFRWRRTDDSSSPFEVYTGVVGQRLVQMRQLPADVQYRVLARSPSQDPAADAAVLHDYFNLSTSLSQLSAQWATKDPRYALVAPALPGCRMLRQDPVECLFQFICSSNNHISRIHGMVERLCSTYGSPLIPSDGSSSGSSRESSVQQQQQGQTVNNTGVQQVESQPDTGSIKLEFSSPGTPAVAVAETGLLSQQPAQQQQWGMLSSAPLPFFEAQNQHKGLSPAAAADVANQLEQQQQQAGEGLPSFFAFPTLEQLSAGTEEALRADGFGYRAKYIIGSVQQLLDKPEGGREWLLGLRDKPYAEAHEALCSLPGVGPKVAACICLFSLDKHDAIPVDTHVWDLATKYYAPHLSKKSLTPKLHAEVQQAFVDRFGPYAGWAHNCLFISELASHRHLLPTGSAAAAAAGSRKQKKRKSQELPGSVAGTEESAAAAGAAGAGSPAAAAVMTPSKIGDGVIAHMAGSQPGAAAAAATDVAAAIAVGLGAAASQDSIAVVRRRRRKPAKLLMSADETAEMCT